MLFAIVSRHFCITSCEDFFFGCLFLETSLFDIWNGINSFLVLTLAWISVIAQPSVVPAISKVLMLSCCKSWIVWHWMFICKGEKAIGCTQMRSPYVITPCVVKRNFLWVQMQNGWWVISLNANVCALVYVNQISMYKLVITSWVSTKPCRSLDAKWLMTDESVNACLWICSERCSMSFTVFCVAQLYW
jgi:hypothetical protein